MVQNPQIQIQFETASQTYAPTDFLSGDYSIRVQPEHQIHVIETSVIWMTEGKGEEDIGVHFFQRRNKTAIQADSISQPHRFSTVLPASPLSYNGKILKIRWCVRVKLFMSDGREITKDRFFDLLEPRIVPQPSATSDNAELSTKPDGENHQA